MEKRKPSNTAGGNVTWCSHYENSIEVHLKKKKKTKNKATMEVKVLLAQSCLTLCSSMDCSPSGSSLHGILQARILEWGSILFLRSS